MSSRVNFAGVVWFVTGLVSMAGMVAAAEPQDESAAKPLRAGIIGLDTSHVVAFTQLLNAPSPKPEHGGRAGCGGVSRRQPGRCARAASGWRASRESCTRNSASKIVNSIDELLAEVDVVLLESVDGRPHLEQARPVLRARKPVFIDKPVAGSLADAIAIFELARETGTPCFSSSSLRFSPGFAAC